MNLSEISEKGEELAKEAGKAAKKVGKGIGIVFNKAKESVKKGAQSFQGRFRV